MFFKVKEERVTEEINRNNGEVYRRQWCFFEVDGIEKPFKINLGKNPPLKVGEYALAPSSFAVDQYDKLTMRYPELVPVVLAKKG